MIFLDTGAFVARHLARDQYHAEATRGWKQLARRGWPMVTTNFVIDETVTLLARRVDARFAAGRARAILGSDRLTIVRPEAEDELAALELLEKFEDQTVSFTDCVSFVTMRTRRIDRAFTFDGHFRLAGFSLWPSSGAKTRR